MLWLSNKGAPSRETFVFTNTVVFGQTFLMNQQGLNLPLNPQDLVPKDSLAHQCKLCRSFEVMARDGGDFVVTFHSGQERLISKNHLLHHDLRIPGFDIFEGMRKVHTCFHVFDDLHAIEAYAVISPSVMVTNLMDPKNYRDAMSRSDAAQWENALKVEMDGLYARNVFSVVDPPDGQTILGTTVVYKTKRDVADGHVTYKARLYLRGDQQKEGVDYFKNKTYSAVLNSRETRIIYALAPVNGWNLLSVDIAQAFTYG